MRLSSFGKLLTICYLLRTIYHLLLQAALLAFGTLSSIGKFLLSLVIGVSSSSLRTTYYSLLACYLPLAIGYLLL